MKKMPPAPIPIISMVRGRKNPGQTIFLKECNPIISWPNWESNPDFFSYHPNSLPLSHFGGRHNAQNKTVTNKGKRFFKKQNNNGNFFCNVTWHVFPSWKLSLQRKKKKKFSFHFPPRGKAVGGGIWSHENLSWQRNP